MGGGKFYGKFCVLMVEWSKEDIGREMEGMLIQNGVHLQEHEYATIKVLLKEGFEISLIPPTQGKGIKTADMTINGVPWEMKAPEGNGKRTIQNTMKRAGKQAENIIIDLRRSKMSEEQAIRELEKEFSMSKKLRHMKIITKNEEIIDFPT